MQDLEPYYRWEKYYISSEDEQSPFYGREYQITYYANDIYGYYIHPMWDAIGSETLYIKLLFVDYSQQIAIIEMLGEWNDTLHNDIMFLKRNVIDHLTHQGIRKYILIGENVMNFHGSDDSYYEEWFEDVEDGWIVGMNFREFVLDEWKKYNLDWYINFGGQLETVNWRTMKPLILYKKVDDLMRFRLGM